MGQKILIIDDDPIIVTYLETLLVNNGYETAIAYDGSDAMSVTTEFKPDLITLDLAMPKEWGPRFYRKLSKKKGCENIPVIIISGLTGREHSINKAIAFFSKPFNPDDVLKTIKEAIGEPEEGSFTLSETSNGRM